MLCALFAEESLERSDQENGDGFMVDRVLFIREKKGTLESAIFFHCSIFSFLGVAHHALFPLILVVLNVQINAFYESNDRKDDSISCI